MLFQKKCFANRNMKSPRGSIVMVFRPSILLLVPVPYRVDSTYEKRHTNCFYVLDDRSFCAIVVFWCSCIQQKASNNITNWKCWEERALFKPSCAFEHIWFFKFSFCDLQYYKNETCSAGSKLRALRK